MFEVSLSKRGEVQDLQRSPKNNRTAGLLGWVRLKTPQDCVFIGASADFVEVRAFQD